MRRALWIPLLMITLGACEADVSLGARCTYGAECDEPLACVLGRCRSECNEHRDCPLDALCLLDRDGNGACSLPEERACGGSDARCAEGLLCIDDACVNACETVAQCPSDSRCEAGADGRARCVRDDRPAADAGADGGPLDAGAGADAGTDAGTACAGDACIVEVVAGGWFTCARSSGGAVWCWGTVLGDGATHEPCVAGVACSPTPVRVRVDRGSGPEPLVGALAIAAGSSSACAILADGAVACWGGNDFGQLGASHDGMIARPVVDVSVAGVLDHVTALAPSNEGWIAVRDEEPSLVAWGDGQDQLRLDGSSAWVATPVALPVTAPDEIAPGGWHACARRGSTVQCWGRNEEGQAGGATTGGGAVVSTPGAIAGLAAPSELASNARGTCALDGDDVRCWGSGFVLGGAGGSEPPCYCSSAPVTVPRGDGARYRALFSSPASNTMFALDDAGRAWCWGYNDVGSICSVAAGYEVRTPVERALPEGVESIAVGWEHACALARGEVWCWGRNDRGTVGDGTRVGPVLEPVRVPLAP